MINRIETLLEKFYRYEYEFVLILDRMIGEIWLSTLEFEQIMQNACKAEDCLLWKKLSNPVYIVLNHVLNKGRTHMKLVMGYDPIIDPFWNSDEICVQEDLLYSCFSYSDEALEEFKKRISWHYFILLDNKYCSYLFKELKIEGT